MKKRLYAAVLAGALLFGNVMPAFAAANVSVIGSFYEWRTSASGTRLYMLGESDEYPVTVFSDPTYEWIDGYCYCFKDTYLQRNATMPDGKKTDGEGRWIRDDGTLVAFSEEFPAKAGVASYASIDDFQKDMNGAIYQNTQNIQVMMNGGLSTCFTAEDSSNAFNNPANFSSSFGTFIPMRNDVASVNVAIGKSPYYGMGNIIAAISCDGGKRSIATSMTETSPLQDGVKVSITVYYRFFNLMTQSEQQAMEQLIKGTLYAAVGTEDGDKMYAKLSENYSGVKGTELWSNEYGEANDKVRYHINNGPMMGGTDCVTLELLFRP